MIKSLTASKTVALFLVFTVISFAEMKLGFINSQKILFEYSGTKDAEEKMKKEYAKLEQEATERQKKIKDMQEQLDKQSLLLSEERKKDIQSNLQKEYADYQKFLQDKVGQDGEYAKKQKDLVQPILDKINVIIEKIAKDENYDFIFDGSTGSPVWAKSAYDLTEKVLQVLNSEKTTTKSGAGAGK